MSACSRAKVRIRLRVDDVQAQHALQTNAPTLPTSRKLENQMPGSQSTSNPPSSAAPSAAANAPEPAIVPKEKSARIAVAPSHPADGDTSGEEDGAEEEAAVEDAEILEDLPDDTQEIELVHSRLSSISKLGLQRFGPYLKKLCLRQNYISVLDPEILKTLVVLEELDLYDNKVKHVGEGLDELGNLLVLDLSFNLLRHVPDTLSKLSSLKTVYFVQNKIAHITNLEGVGRTLRSLELGGNRIRTIENLDALEILEELWLGKNKISKLENLGRLKRLKILSIQSNRITKLEGLENLENLEELYLSHNGIERLEGLEHNLKLRTLDIGNNFVPALENISHLINLEELWINDNKITSLTDLEPQLKHVATLETIYLEGNPCQKSEGSSYRRKVVLALPQVKQLDATFVKQT